MPLTDRNSIRYIPGWVVLLPLFFLACFVVSVSIEYAKNLDPKCSVRWLNLEQAEEACRRTHKPIFLFVTASWCGPCKVFKRDILSDSEIGKLINRDFFPVCIASDYKWGAEQEPPEIKMLKRKYLQWVWFPYITIIPYEALDARGNLSHTFSCQGERARVQTFRQWLKDSKNKARILEPQGVVNWVNLDQCRQKAKDEHKPILFFFTRSNDIYSEKIRAEIFKDDELNAIINSKFVPVLLCDHGSKALNDPRVNQLESEFALTTLPALAVSADNCENPELLFGFPGTLACKEFLTRAIVKAGAQ